MLIHGLPDLLAYVPLAKDQWMGDVAQATSAISPVASAMFLFEASALAGDMPTAVHAYD